MAAFDNRTHGLRATSEVRHYFRRFGPPSTDNTPERSRLPPTNPPISTRATLAEEAIYDRPIDSELPIISAMMNEAIVRRIVSETVQAAAAHIAAAAQAQNSENSGNSGNSGSTTSPDPAARLERPQFRPREVEYFDPAPGPAIEANDNHNVYHNVFSFTTRLRVKATTMNASLLRPILDSCLLSAAENWYTNELAPSQSYRFTERYQRRERVV